MPIFPDILELKQQCVSEQHSIRVDAVSKLQSWSSLNPGQSAGVFLEWARTDDNPELRERAIDLLKWIARSEYGKFGQGFIGISMGNPVELTPSGFSESTFGIPITALHETSPAGKAGLRVGDVIFAVGDHRWSNAEAISSKTEGISARIRQAGVNVMVRLQLMRSDQVLTIEVQTVRRPVGLDQMRLEIGPLGVAVPDQELISRLAKEERDSDAYFYEWLDRHFIR